LGEIDTDSSTHSTDVNNHNLSYMYRWKNERKDMYIESLETEEIHDKFNLLCDSIHLSQSTADLDSNLICFTDILADVCDPLFKKNIRKLPKRLYLNKKKRCMLF